MAVIKYKVNAQMHFEMSGNFLIPPNIDETFDDDIIPQSEGHAKASSEKMYQLNDIASKQSRL